MKVVHAVALAAMGVVTACTGPKVGRFGGLNMGLASLPRLSDAETRSI